MVAPVLDWDGETADLTPDFLVDFDEGDVVEGNEVALKIYSNAGLTHLVRSTTHNLTEAEILAGEIDVSAAALANNWTYYARVRVEGGTWSNTETIVLGDGVSGTEPAYTLEETASGGGGGGGVYFGPGPEEGWAKRRKKLKELEGLIDEARGIIPDDVAEAIPVKQAARKAEKIDEALQEPAPVFPPQADLRAISAAISQVRKALEDYKARQLELAEEDDEEFLLLLD